MARVTFLGACGAVTGSSTLVEWGETSILVDRGLYQGDDELEQENWRRPRFVPKNLGAVVVTHAHLDHTGLLPRLIASGFKGPIYCTRPSRGLISLILQDAGHLQEEQARYARKKSYSRHADPRPLYTSSDARDTLRLLKPKPFGEVFDITPGIRCQFIRAGHLLGAASVEITAKGRDGNRRRWLFSGDVGRYSVPILQDPEAPSEAPHTLVLESTYGDREHVASNPVEGFRQRISRTFARGGTVVIPAFALGRTQEVLYHLSSLADSGDLDPADVFLDSPMAIKATEIYDDAESEHDEELKALISREIDVLGPDRFQRCRSVEQSKALNERRRPAVIVAASGMANGGRVVHHLKRLLPEERNAVIFVGYQAAGTRGRALVNGAESVAIHGQRVPVRAEVCSLHGLSAHADQDGLVRWCRALPEPPKRILLNHGEDPARKALAAALAANGLPKPTLPYVGDTFSW